MPTDADPIVESWYENLENNQKFKVVALDDALGIVEIQHFDGSLEELDMESWYLLDLEPISDPDDWAGALDDLEQNASDYPDSDLASDAWDTQPRLARSHETADEIEYGGPLDDWGEGFPEEEPWEENR